MTIKVKHTGLPPELALAVAEHAAAFVAGDDHVVAKFADDRAAAESDATIRRAAALRPFVRYEIIARARLGFQYMVKLRLCGKRGDLNLQTRWHQVDGVWAITEIENIGLESPWKRPAQEAMGGKAQ
ncbi:MAG TPA: hypothetical protein VGG60_11530 [Candidatus Binataceae bacterium]|jgi:hypothetical protein